MVFDKSKIEDSVLKLYELKHKRIIELVEPLSNGNYRLKVKALPEKGGIYSFWWTGDISIFKSNIVNRSIRFKGPKGRDVNIEITNQWIECIEMNRRVPLYIGKSADSLKRESALT